MSIAKIAKARNIVQQSGLIQLNSARSTTSSIGLVGSYTSDGSKYAGLFRDNSAGAWSLFDSLTTNPLLTDTVSAGYALSTLNIGALNALSLNSATITHSGDITIGGTGKVTLSSAYIDVAPTGAMGVANKSYVDSLVSSAVQGWAAKESVVARTVSALTVTASGSGATKILVINTGNTVATVTTAFDGVLIKAGDRVLVADQAAAQDNGIYVAQPGFCIWGQSSWTLLRAADANATSELSVGAHVFVEAGTLYQSTGWVLKGPFTSFVMDGTPASYFSDPRGGAWQQFNGVRNWLDMDLYVALGTPSTTGYTAAQCDALTIGIPYDSTITNAQRVQVMSNNVPQPGAQTWIKFSNTFMAAANIGAGASVFSSLVGTQFQFNSMFASQVSGSSGLLTVDSSSNANGLTYKFDQSKLTGTGALITGSIGSGFGAIATSSLIAGSSFSATGSLFAGGAASLTGGLAVLSGLTSDKITTSTILLTDALAAAMDIKNGSQSFMSFCTTATPSVTMGQATKLLSTLTVAGVSSLKAVGMTDLVATTATVQSLRCGVMDLSASTTLDSTMSIINVTTGASVITITLPPAAANSGRSFKIAKPDAGAGSVSIVVSSGDVLDGTSSAVVLEAQYDHTRVTSHGGGWYLH